MLSIGFFQFGDCHVTDTWFHHVFYNFIKHQRQTGDERFFSLSWWTMTEGNFLFSEKLQQNTKYIVAEVGAVTQGVINKPTFTRRRQLRETPTFVSPCSKAKKTNKKRRRCPERSTPDGSGPDVCFCATVLSKLCGSKTKLYVLFHNKCLKSLC